MKIHTKRSFIILGILGFICLTILPGRSFATPQEDLIAAEKKLDELNAAISNKQKRYQDLTVLRAKFSKEITDKVVTSPGDIKATKDAIVNIDTEMKTVASEITKLNEQVATPIGARDTAIKSGAIPIGETDPNSGLTEKSITEFLKWVAEKAITYVLVIAAIFIILAGYIYITSLGNTTKVEQAKQMLLYTVIGVLVVMGAYLAVNTLLSQVATTPTSDPTLIAPTPSLTPAKTP